MKEGQVFLLAAAFVMTFLFGGAAEAYQNYIDIWNWSFQINDGEGIEVKEDVYNAEYLRVWPIPLRIYGWGPTNGNPVPHELGLFGIESNKAYILEFRFEAETAPDNITNAIDLNYWEGIEGNGSPIQRNKRNFFMRQHPNSPSSHADPNVYDLPDLTNGFTQNAQIWLPDITASTPRSPAIYDKWNMIISNYADIQPSVVDGNYPDGKVTFQDFSGLAKHWQSTDCDSANSWCDYADLNRDGVVDYNDLEPLTK